MLTTPEALISQTADLVSLPDSYLRVKAVVDDPRSSLAELTEVVSHDPSIAARLLKLANSAFFGFTAKIDAISRAVNLLGSQQIHDLVLATTVADAFSKLSPNTMAMHKFWANSIHCGLLAKSLGNACGLIDVERFFVEGLLHDIGHLILDQSVPDACAAVFARAHEEIRPVFLVEREVLGFETAEVGSALLESWSFPRGFVEAIRWQNKPAMADSYALEAAVLHASVNLLRASSADLNSAAALAMLDANAVEVTGVSEEILSVVSTQSAEALTQTYELLFPNMPPRAGRETAPADADASVSPERKWTT